MTDAGRATKEGGPGEASVPEPATKTLVESLLFVASEPIELGRLERLLGVGRGAVDEALAELTREYAGRGVRLQRLGESVQLVSAPECAAVVERFLGLQPDTRLSAAALETLAIVAYRQPITRAAIEAIRGVNCDRALSTLISRGLVTEAGRLDTVGRPVLFATTFEFLRYFGLSSLDELPPIPEAEAE